MLFEYSELCTNVSVEEMQKITNILSESEIEYKIKARMPFNMHPFDSATVGGIGRTSGSFDIRYSIFVKRDSIEYALSRVRQK